MVEFKHYKIVIDYVIHYLKTYSSSKFHYMSLTAHLYSKLLLYIDLILLKMSSLLL